MRYEQTMNIAGGATVDAIDPSHRASLLDAAAADQYHPW
jgi:hypothetical protein